MDLEGKRRSSFHMKIWNFEFGLKKGPQSQKAEGKIKFSSTKEAFYGVSCHKKE